MHLTHIHTGEHIPHIYTSFTYTHVTIHHTYTPHNMYMYTHIHLTCHTNMSIYHTYTPHTYMHMYIHTPKIKINRINELQYICRMKYFGSIL